MKKRRAFLVVPRIPFESRMLYNLENVTGLRARFQTAQQRDMPQKMDTCVGNDFLLVPRSAIFASSSGNKRLKFCEEVCYIFHVRWI